MKKLLLITAIAGLTCLSLAVNAQNEKGDKGDKGDKGSKESQEIIIRKKGDKDAKITVEISGDKVTINGKPLAEFKDDHGKGNQRYTFSPRDFEGLSGTWSDDNAGSRAFLGVTTEKADGGARITDITKESAAEKAGLKEGDVIVKLGDRNIDGPDALYDAVSGQKPKDEVKLSYKRDGKESSTKAVLGERKNSGAMAYSFTGPDGMARTYTIPRVNPAPKVEMWNDRNFGETFPKIYSPGLGETYNYFGDMYPRQQKLGLKIQDTEDGKGVKVLDVDKDSPAEKAGLKKDDIVTEIGGEKVSNTDEAREQLHDNAEKGSYNIKATRNGNAMSFDIKIPKKLKTANL